LQKLAFNEISEARMKVKTVNGSVYDLNTEKKIWKRIEKSEASGAVRRETEWIPYISFHGNVGQGLIIVMDPLPESAVGTINRVIYTSDIAEVLHDSPSQG
jgi:uncharacterized protein YlxW (UPF0749 family)